MRRLVPVVLFLIFFAAPAGAADGGWVAFDSADGTPIRGWYAPPGGPGAHGAANQGKHPGVVMLHGCSGPVTTSGKVRSRERSWIKRLTAQGYAVVLADSFGPRGYGSLCTVRNRPVRPERERPWDAVGALKWLAAQPGVDKSRIAVMGWSNGAMSTLWTVRAGASAASALDGTDFAAAVVFYPGCMTIKRKVPDWRPRMPLLLQMGSADDWTQPVPCRQLMEEARGRGAAVEMDFYAGAYHAFDSPGRTVHTRSIPFSSGPKDVHVGPNPAAREAAVRRTLDWLAAQLR